MVQIIVIIAAIIFYGAWKITNTETFKRIKLKWIVQLETGTKVTFSYKTKIMGVDHYIFCDDKKAYTVSEFGKVCGYKNL